MGHNSTGWSYQGQQIKVIAKRPTYIVIELGTGERIKVKPSDLKTIPKVTNGLKGR